MKFLYIFCKVLKYNFLKSVHWEPSYSVWTDGWTDSRQVTHTRFSKMCETPDIVHFVIYKK